MPAARWLLAIWAALVFSPATAGATALRINAPLCHATAAEMPARFDCSGEPQDYQQGILWLRAAVPPDHSVLLIHQTRFEALGVVFHYADGFAVRQHIARGDYGEHWRIGGQIVFEAPKRTAPLTAVTLGFDHLTSDTLLRIRMLSPASANLDLALAAVLSGGALALLLAGGIYNLSLAIALRRQFLAWHGLWAICMVLWGLFWSQTALIALPGVAGTAASQTCTFLACLAITTATLSVATALKALLHRWVWRLLLMLGLSVAALGIPAALALGQSLDMIGDILGLLVLVDLSATALCIAWGWWGGSKEARDLARAWGVPMVVLALTQIFDFNTTLFGGGAQIAVLFASAPQTIWLSIIATRQLSLLRIELDAARAAEIALAELANRDPLTGLLNRRGFVEYLRQIFAGGNDASLALLLIDVDLFKSINDQFGHETGDTVLCRIADYFRRLERELCISGRMGGEEFVLAVSGLTSFSLAQFAERVRAELAACDHGEVTKYRLVTVSIGVAEGSTRTSFQNLYAAADRALYDAKRSGRNKVVFHAGPLDLQLREELERDQLTLPWPAQ
jgi:diguanylate cyclase (GGDEF)-like protein